MQRWAVLSIRLEYVDADGNTRHGNATVETRDAIAIPSQHDPTEVAGVMAAMMISKLQDKTTDLKTGK